MQSGFYDAAGGMVTQFNRLDMISQNLANSRTHGYKRRDVVIGDFMRIYQQKRDELPLPNQTKEAAKFVNRTVNRVPRVVEKYADWSMGPIKHTGNPLDLALNDKNLFFAVDTPNGIRLTRDGAFKMDEQGRLVTRDGYKVMSESYFMNKKGITIPPESIQVGVSRNGKMEYFDKTSMDQPIYVDHLMIVRVDHPEDLRSEGDNYLYMPGRDLRKDMNIVTDSNAVYQYMIETSNVNPVSEMTALIDTNRLVEMYQKVMDAQMNEMNGEAINKLASVRV